MKNRKGRLLEEDLEVGGTRRGVVEKKGAFDRSIAVVNKLQKATKLTTRTRIHIFINIYGGRETDRKSYKFSFLTYSNRLETWIYLSVAVRILEFESKGNCSWP